MSCYDIALNIVNDYNLKVNLVGHKAVKYESRKAMHHIQSALNDERGMRMARSKAVRRNNFINSVVGDAIRHFTL